MITKTKRFGNRAIDVAIECQKMEARGWAVRQIVHAPEVTFTEYRAAGRMIERHSQEFIVVFEIPEDGFVEEPVNV